MATAAVARPVNVLRRRDGPRPTVNKRAPNMELADQAPVKRRRLEEPYVRTSDYILKKHNGKPPSLVIHLHPAYFRFDGQDGSWAYNSSMKVVLEHMRKQTVPHEILKEMLQQNVPFYDGCLIVEVHNHRGTAGKDHGRNDSRGGEDNVKFSMHNYNEHVTPSPMVAFPAKAKTAESSDKPAGSDSEQTASSKRGKETDKAGPKVTTIVLHPTALTRHHELLILAETPASEMRGKRKTGDNATPSSARPGSPPFGVPSTPIIATHGPLSQSQKMCLEEGDYYSFQADLLVATEPPLYLDPVNSFEESQKLLEMMAHPLHQEKPPSPKTRKRTTAEMAADDAQAAESERRMLIMDERIKPSARAGVGATANDNQSAAASLGFSRFKTIEMVRQKHEEQERVKKDEETRAAMEKRQVEERAAAQAAEQQQQLMQKQHQAEVMRQRQVAQRQRHQEQARQLQMLEAQRAAQMAREHAHPQQNQMMANGQQVNYALTSSMPQNSPVVRQQTPMMNSSPMMAQGGFPMTQSSSQGAGSPQRPSSAAMQNRNVAMARQASLQHSSQNGTPNLGQGTPSLAHAMPNRQMTHTPRMVPGSPAMGMQGTPTSAPGMPMSAPQMNGGYVSQQMLLAMQSQQQGQQLMAADISEVRNRQHHQLLAQQQQANQRSQQHANNPQTAQVMRQKMMQHQRQLQQQGMSQAQAMQMGQPGGPGLMHGLQTPQTAHMHPQTPGHPGQQGQQQGQPGGPTQAQLILAQQRQMAIAAQRNAQHQIQQLSQQYGGWQHIPAAVVTSLPPAIQNLLRRQQGQVQQRQIAAQAARNMSPNGQQVVPGGQADPAYMNQLRQTQDLLRQHQQNQQQQQANGAGNGTAGGGSPGAAGMNVNMAGFNSGAQGTGRQADHLSQHFAQMQNALNQNRGPGGQNQQQQQGGGGGAGMQ